MTAIPDPTDAESVLFDGPWTHRMVSGGGTRFHVAELGSGPTVLLLHGFPQFWYSMRHLMVALAGAGYHAVAMDLRGYGASDKPPRGYDTYAGCRDAAAVLNALGVERAVILGQGLGGAIAWCMPTFEPDSTRAVVALSMAHPRVMREAIWRHGPQRAASRWMMRLQAPFAPERAMEHDHDYVAGVLRGWSAPRGPFPGEADIECYGNAMQLPFVAHSAAEHYRWFGRSQLRPDGPLFNHRIAGPARVPVLQVQGADDGCVLAGSTNGSAQYAAAGYDYHLLEDAGHFLAEEAPDRVADLLVAWLGEQVR